MTPDVTIEIYGSLGVIILSAIIYIISKMIFDRRTNKALANDGNGSGRKMLSPVAVTAIAAAVMLIGLAVVPHIVNIGSGRGDIEFIFETKKNAYTPDLNRYTLVTELSAETEEYLIYRAAKKRRCNLQDSVQMRRYSRLLTGRADIIYRQNRQNRRDLRT